MGLRGRESKLCKAQVNLDIRKFFSSIRVMDVWNSLPERLLHCSTVGTFRRRLHYFMKDQRYQ